MLCFFCGGRVVDLSAFLVFLSSCLWKKFYSLREIVHFLSFCSFSWNAEYRSCFKSKSTYKMIRTICGRGYILNFTIYLIERKDYLSGHTLLSLIIMIRQLTFPEEHLVYLKGRNFRGKKISRISRILAWFAKINSFFDPQKCRFTKINSLIIFQNWWFTKINSLEIFQQLMKCEYWSFCLIQCLLN